MLLDVLLRLVHEFVIVMNWAPTGQGRFHQKRKAAYDSKHLNQ